MSRPLRYRTEMDKGIGQHKTSYYAPLTVDDVAAMVCLVGLIAWLIWLCWFAMEGL